MCVCVCQVMHALEQVQVGVRGEAPYAIVASSFVARAGAG